MEVHLLRAYNRITDIPRMCWVPTPWVHFEERSSAIVTNETSKYASVCTYPERLLCVT